MQDSQSFGLFNVRLSGLLGEQLPPPPQLLGDLCIVLVRRHLDDLPPFQLRPDHEGIHGSLDVIWRMLFGLENKQKKGTLEKYV